MATAQQLKALLQSYSEADGEMFVSVALQIAAHEARTGKGKFAAEIKRLVDEIKGEATGIQGWGFGSHRTPSRRTGDAPLRDLSAHQTVGNGAGSGANGLAGTGHSRVPPAEQAPGARAFGKARSEERRVGKECRSRGSLVQ